jgi:AmiR/NasT family two-component response regulator
MEGGPMDVPDSYELTWHEDDKLHQAEGMLSARLGLSVDEAVNAIHRRAEASTLTLSEVATQVLGEARGAAR